MRPVNILIINDSIEDIFEITGFLQQYFVDLNYPDSNVQTFHRDSPTMALQAIQSGAVPNPNVIVTELLSQYALLKLPPDDILRRIAGEDGSIGKLQLLVQECAPITVVVSRYLDFFSHHRQVPEIIANEWEATVHAKLDSIGVTWAISKANWKEERHLLKECVQHILAS
jgi:hypothetical protein